MPTSQAELEMVATRAAREATRLLHQSIDEAARKAADRVSLGPDEVRDLVSHAVTQTLLQLGVDAANPIEMQRDFQHLRQWRTAQAELRTKGMIALMAVVLSGFVALLLLGVKEWFNTK